MKIQVWYGLSVCEPPVSLQVVLAVCTAVREKAPHINTKAGMFAKSYASLVAMSMGLVRFNDIEVAGEGLSAATISVTELRNGYRELIAALIAVSSNEPPVEIELVDFRGRSEIVPTEPFMRWPGRVLYDFRNATDKDFEDADCG